MINLIKLSVGSESIHTLLEWQQIRRAQNLSEFGVDEIFHVTRMRPKRQTELLDGGSIYWVIKGAIRARQSIMRLDEVTGEDGIRRCKIVLANDLTAVENWPKRAFQGWRYLKVEDSPPDVAMPSEAEDDMPKEMVEALDELGLL